jgi:mono/diheme cytochrome c family protein
MNTSRKISSLVVSVFLSGVLVAPSSAAQGDPAAGKATYDKTCGMCHGPKGKGEGTTAAVLPTKPRNHTAGNYMNSAGTDYLFKIIKEGGAAVGKAHHAGLGDATQRSDIWNVIAYIRTIAVPPVSSGGDQAPRPRPAAAPASGQSDKNKRRSCELSTEEASSPSSVSLRTFWAAPLLALLRLLCMGRVSEWEHCMHELTLTLPDELHIQLQAQAARKGLPLEGFIRSS